ncbi:MAG: methyltransferase domain-containing protein [Candidatus Dormibacteria bacterium]
MGGWPGPAGSSANQLASSGRDLTAGDVVIRSACERWADALEEWAIPERIQALAPEPPWVLPTSFFKVEAPLRRDTRPSLEVARAALGTGGSVLDVGCGGGGGSVPLVPLAVEIAGVDERAGMLTNFAAACAEAEVAHTEVEGKWPETAGLVDPADVVVCHHVVYNVALIAPFLRALTEHARRLVVVELTATHPTAPFNYLWEHFWQLPRPSEPTAQLFLEVVRELGYQPVEQSWRRPPDPPRMTRAEYVAFARRRLCLSSDRDAEVAEALGENWHLEVPQLVAVSWAPERS